MRRRIGIHKPGNHQSGNYAAERNEFTSLIDVVFLLLIFFMCATTFKVPEGSLDSFLPRAGDDGESPERPLRITLAMADNGEVMVWTDDLRVSMRASDGIESAFEHRRGVRAPDEQVILDHMVARRDNYTGRSARGLAVIIDFERDVPSKYVVQLLNICYRAEVEDVSFARPEIPIE